MDIPSFDSYLNHRRNILDEGWFDWMWQKNKGPSEYNPTPEEVQKDPEVAQHVERILKTLGVLAANGSPNPLPMVDSRGQPTGKTWDGVSRLDTVVNSLKSVVGAHMYGGGDKNVGMRVHSGDIIGVIRFLDSLQNPHGDGSLLDSISVQDASGFNRWLQGPGRVPQHAGAMVHHGFNKDSDDFARRRETARGEETFPATKVITLWEKAVEVVKLVRPSSSKQLKNAVEQLQLAADNVRTIPSIAPAATSTTGPAATGSKFFGKPIP